MGKENEKEISKEFPHKFLPQVRRETVKKTLLELKSNSAEFTLTTINQIKKDNSNLFNFLFWRSQDYHSPPSFYLGAAFTYRSLFYESKKTKTFLPRISKETIQMLLTEINREAEGFEKKHQSLLKRAFEKLPHPPEKQKTFKFFICSESISEIYDILHDFSQKDRELLKKLKRNLNSILPYPQYYSKENPFLMEEIEKLSSIQPPHIAIVQTIGAMFTYELLRRQAETDYLEKNWEKDFN